MNQTIHFVAVFEQPFHLKAAEGELSAGAYCIVRHEEVIEGASFVVFRRTETYIELLSSKDTSLFLAPISEAELAIALLQAEGSPVVHA